MNHVYLLLGSNQGKRAVWIQEAVELLQNEAGNIVQQSVLYETAAWGKTDQPGFLNQAAGLRTVYDPHHLLQIIQSIEQRMGRLRLERWGQRTLDIDILFFNDSIIQTPELCIPHPELPNRRFALQPLCDIAPSLIHPILRITVQQLLENCTDPLPVNYYKVSV